MRSSGDQRAEEYLKLRKTKSQPMILHPARLLSRTESKTKPQIKKEGEDMWLADLPHVKHEKKLLVEAVKKKTTGPTPGPLCLARTRA